jgi:DNA-binding transcriptional ArsR family regulator
VGELVEALGVAQPSVSKHLARLKAAGLVDLRADAQRRVYRLTPEPLRGVDAWLTPYRRQLRAAAPLEMATLVRGADGVSLNFDLHVTARRELVWKALTQPAQTQDWLGTVSIEPQFDGRYKVRFLEGEMVMSCRIAIWEPEQKLVYRWRSGPRKRTTRSPASASTSTGMTRSPACPSPTPG